MQMLADESRYNLHRPVARKHPRFCHRYTGIFLYFWRCRSRVRWQGGRFPANGGRADDRRRFARRQWHSCPCILYLYHPERTGNPRQAGIDLKMNLNKKTLIQIVVLVLVVVIAAGVYFRMQGGEDLVVGGLAAPEIVVVHGGQVVVDEGIGVDHLERAGAPWRRRRPGRPQHSAAAIGPAPGAGACRRPGGNRHRRVGPPARRDGGSSPRPEEARPGAPASTAAARRRGRFGQGLVFVVPS